MWNNVPYIDETITYGNRNYHVGNEKNIWPDIENDLKYAMDNLSDIPYREPLAGPTNILPWHCWQKHICFRKNFRKQSHYLKQL